MQQSVRRLVEGFSPSHYDLHITQNSALLTFSGQVTIVGVRGVGELAFHSSNLTVSTVVINSKPVKHVHNEELQELILDDHSDQGAQLTVTIEFNGIITSPMHGLYPCYFEGENGKECILATQFESHHAREVFPCIDEPEAKATFQLHLTVPNNDVAVSNTPIESDLGSQSLDLRTVTFEVTPRMSTYLLAWVSGNLVYDEATSSHGVSVRAYTTPLHKGKTAYALNIATRTLDYLDDYFAIPYPLNKYDIVALPDFAAAAMENWGLVTYREGSMLIDELNSDLADKQHVANVTIHELSHQWFGNLVTMRWWNDLWLNEGFASFVPYIVMEDLFPEWKSWEQFTSDDLAIGLRADALHHTHPIVVDINSPEEIRSAFDSISYDKGCSVINLVYHYIGKESFRSGLQDYLSVHAYGNAKTGDLWAAWSKSSGKDVHKFMKTWTETPGFPLLKVSTEGKGMLVEQTRFYLDPTHSPCSTVWPVPLMRYEGDQDLIDTPSAVFDKVSKINAGQSGFYRTIYSGQIKTKIEQTLKNGTISPLDALGLITDASEAAMAGFHSTTEALGLIQYVSTSTHEPLISGALGEIAEYRSIFSECYESFKPFVKYLAQHNFTRLGVDTRESDTVDDLLLRPLVFASMVYAGDDGAIAWALDQFKDATRPEDIRADIRSVVYQATIKHNLSTETYNTLLDWYENCTIPGEQMPLASALCGVEDQALFERSLSLIATNKVKLQDARFWIAYALRNRLHKQLAWEWVKNNWQWIGDNYGKEKEIDYLLRYAASGFATAEHLADYSDYFSSVDIYGSERAFEQGKETIRWQTAWKQRDAANVKLWLNSFTAQKLVL